MSYYIDVRVLEYNDTNGRSPYKDWFDGLDASGCQSGCGRDTDEPL